MSYSSAVSLNYQPNYDQDNVNYLNPPTFPLLTNSSSAVTLPVAASGLLTNSATGGIAVPFTVASYPMPTGIWALRFEVELIIAGDVQPTNIYLSIQPANGTVSIENCVMNSGTPAAGQYNYTADVTVMIIGNSNDPTVGNTLYQVVGFWAGDGTITIQGSSGASYVKLA
jgi:hypothetical protein